MAQESKAIDLGKLQDALRSAEARVKSADALKINSYRAFEKARTKMASDHDAWVKAKDSLDNAKKAVIEGARTIAQG
jgi:hypothetical protein